MVQPGNVIEQLTAPFKAEGKYQTSLVLTFVLINTLVLLNACLHDPTIGYDSFSHLDYIQAFAKGHLVSAEESDEFFSPPLPYVFPAALIATSGASVSRAAKLAQFLNVLLSIGLTYYLVKICRAVSPARIVAFGALLFLGLLPVYYKTFAFVRGEPYMAFFAVVAMYYFIHIFARHEDTWWNIVAAGLALGGCILSRQWGVMLVPAIGLFAVLQWLHQKERRRFIVKATAISLAIAFLVSGWFYLGLKRKYGSVTAFNRVAPAAFSFQNQPGSFYFGIAPDLLFSKPVRPNFPNQLIPILYSEVWGDYWGYFLFFGKDSRLPPDARRLTGSWLYQLRIWEEVPPWMVTNYRPMGAYLGRVNLVSIFPSLLAIGALAIAIGEIFRQKAAEPSRPSVDPRRKSIGLLLLVLAFSFGGYLWFLILYPNLEKGDTIKATYLLHTFPFVAVLVGLLLENIERRSPLISRIAIGGLLVVAVHNLPAMLTHYPVTRVPWDIRSDRAQTELGSS